MITLHAQIDAPHSDVIRLFGWRWSISDTCYIIKMPEMKVWTSVVIGMEWWFIGKSDLLLEEEGIT